jgi:hypothetical protein
MIAGRSKPGSSCISTENKTECFWQGSFLIQFFSLAKECPCSLGLEELRKTLRGLVEWLKW